MNANYIEMIKGILGEMDKKKMDPVGKADADIDNDGDVDSSDKYLHKRRKAISKSMKKEDDAKVTKCPSCEGSMDNHDPECPKAKSEGCGDYDKKSKKEEVEQVAEVRDHVEYNNQPVVSEQWGFGEVIETTDEGLNVYFDHGVEFNVPAESLTFLEDKKHTKGATAPEGLLDKESPRSKKFVKDHQKSDKSVEDLETKGHVDATKAGRATTKQAPARPGEKRVGDIKIVNPVQGAVTQTTGKE